MRLRRESSHLGKAEPHGKERPEHARILVEAGCHANRIGETEPPKLLHKPRIVRLRFAGVEAELQSPDGELMRPLRIEREQQSLAEAIADATDKYLADYARRLGGASPGGR